MKKIVLVLIAVCFIATPVFAQTTSKAKYSVPSSQGFEDFLNNQDYITHTHEYSKYEPNKVKKFQKQIGLDVITYENALLKIKSETRYNFESSVTTSGVVVELNAFKFFNK